MGVEAVHAPVERSYGWHPSVPDVNAPKFEPSPSVMAALPPVFSLIEPSPGAPFDPCWDQGKIGSCGPHSLAENLVFDMLKLGITPKMPSRLFIYYIARMLMNTTASDSGVDNRTMLEALEKYGWCDEDLWPYDVNKFTTRPPDACFQAAAARAGKFQRQTVAQDLGTMKSCLIQTQRPFVIGFSVYPSLETQQVDVTGDIPMPMFGERQIGGHDVLAVSWNDTTQRFGIKNHWTPRWGHNGYGTIPYAYAINRQLAGDFHTVVNIDAPVPVPQPIPFPPGPGPGPGPLPIPLPSNIDKATLLAVLNNLFAKVEAKQKDNYFYMLCVKMVEALILAEVK